MMGHGWNVMGWGSWGIWGGPGLAGLVVSAVFWIGILAIVAAGLLWLARQLGRQPGLVRAGDIPLGEARRRLASGNISSSEYDEIVDRLQAKVRSVD